MEGCCSRLPRWERKSFSKEIADSISEIKKKYKKYKKNKG